MIPVRGATAVEFPESSWTARPAAGARVEVLGPVEVSVDGRRRASLSPMAQHVMSLLLLDAGQPVSTENLIDELWDVEPPRLARKTVQTYIYQLRQVFRGDGANAAERVSTTAGGYRLNLAEGELDLWEFERRVASGRSALAEGAFADAARSLRAGLGMWRGKPFAGVATGPLLSARRAQIADARLTAVELRVEADLHLDRHQALVPELRRLTALHPLDERFTEQLMIAAQRSGERTTALDAYARLRQRMADELGLEPSERLRCLQREALRGTHSTAGARRRLAASASASASSPSAYTSAPGSVLAAPVGGGKRPPTRPAVDQLPVETTDFVGGERELRQIAEYLAEPVRTAIALLGPVGIGKTTLAVHAARMYAERFPDGLLYASLHDRADRPRDSASTLRFLLRGLGVSTTTGEEDVEALAALFRAATRDRSLLVLLDDAADTQQVLPLLPGGISSQVMVTSRVRLSALPGARSLALRPLGEADSMALFAQASGVGPVAENRDLLSRIIARIGGHPFIVRAMGEEFAARPMWTLDGLAAGLVEDRQILAELRDCAMLTRARCALARLAPYLLSHLQALAVAVPCGTLSACDVARILRLDMWSAESTIGRLMDRHVLVTAATAVGRPTVFRLPDLIRLALLDQATDPKAG